MATHTDDFGSGWQQWNFQAWFDFIIIKMMMSKVGDVIPKTYVPILRLVAEDKGKVDDEYARVVDLRERVRLFDSPRDKWRKMYGSYVRELDWVYCELRKYFPKEEYEELVVDIMARNIRGAMSAFLPNLEKMTRTGASPAAAGEKKEKSGAGRFVEKIFAGPIGRWMFEHMNPMSPIVGPVELNMKPADKKIELFIPVCWMHTAPGDGRTQDEACLQGCKGACERV
ncbi:MAG: hypothetical protein JRG96_15495, partial [Deltaproteobacteria bacterium]|nr:hypothetical protein [Deltaproteobacteria bacterium]